MRKIGFILLVAISMVACNSRQNEALVKKSSSGKTLEVLIAADKGYYTGATKSLIDSIFRQPQEGLPQPEPRFDVVNVPVSSLYNTQMFQMHRNVIICDIKESNKDKVYVHHNQWAAPQVVVDIAASSEASLQGLLRKYEPVIVSEIYKAEHERIISAFYNHRNVSLMKRVEDKFGFGLTLSEEFTWADEDADFAWIRKETKDFGLDVLVHTEPYGNAQQLDTTKILNRLDTIMRRHVAGPAEGSYMGTERRVPITQRKVEYEGSDYCIESRGLWRLFGDFMGGPFVAYTILSPDSKQVVDVVGFVYCPRFDKRDYLMQVESICHSIKWGAGE